MVGSWLPDE